MSNIITKEKTISSCDDFELNIKREQKLTYKYSYPMEKKLKGIVFNIHGFGAEVAYMDNLREYIADTFDVLCVDVYYHCFFSRPENGATVEFDNLDLLILQDFIDKYNIDFSDVEDINTKSILYNLDKKINILKAKNIFSDEYKIKLPITIIPKNNEYQNFGMMQAVDYVNVLYDIEKIQLNFTDNYPVSLIGTSHGGYLAHLIAKIAPHKINNIIDNSSYVKAPLNYFLGKESNITKPEYQLGGYNNIILNCFVQTLWTTNKKSNFYFTNGHSQIRNLNNKEHINQESEKSQNKIKFVSYHSNEDLIANINDKIMFYKTLQEYGFHATLNIINSPFQVDGKFIKNLSHGMNMSLKELANKELPIALKNINTDNIKNVTINYTCDNITYIFKHDTNRIEIKVLK